MSWDVQETKPNVSSKMDVPDTASVLTGNIRTLTITSVIILLADDLLIFTRTYTIFFVKTRRANLYRQVSKMTRCFAVVVTLAVL